jgi:hypothetical protein
VNDGHRCRDGEEIMVLRKQVISTSSSPPARSEGAKDIPKLATVLVTSEDAEHPIDRIFDGERGRGATRWIAAGTGEQTVILAFDAPQTIRTIVIEVEETSVSRTQEIVLAVSDDGGQAYRNLVRQEYNFSPPGTTFEHEEWSVNVHDATHLRIGIKPDNGDKACRATLTTVALID